MLTKKIYHTNPRFSQCLLANRVFNSKKFFKEPMGKLIANEPGQNIRFIELPFEGKPTGFYLKQNSIRLRAIKRFLLKGIVSPLPTTQEAKMTAILAQHDLPVATVVIWGEQLLFGILPIRGFMLSREILGEEAVGLFEKEDIRLRRRILFSTGKITAKLAEIGFYYAPRMRDFICTRDDGETVELALIDREVRVPELVQFSEQATYELISRAYWKMIRNGHPLLASEFRSFIGGFIKGLSSSWKPTKREVLLGCLEANYRLHSKIKQIAELIDLSEFSKIMQKRYKKTT